MPNEALENALYQRMAAEQDQFKAELLQLTPEEILQKAREYVTRENILQVLGDYPGTEAQTRTLLKSDTPLASIYAELEKQSSDNGINEIKECVESLTDAIAAAEAEQREALRNLPVYPYPADYARQNGELEQYRASYKANVTCKEAIEAAINGNYADNSLDTKTAIRQVTEVYGYPRTLHVLANTIKHKDWDGRFSADNKRWAAAQHVFEDKDGFGSDRNIYFVVDKAHPGLVDMFATRARREYLLSLPLTVQEVRGEAQRLLDRLKAPTGPNSPNGTHYMAEISPDFLARSNSRDLTMLQKFLPYKSLTLTTMKDRKGVFAVISGNEKRDRKLREPRPSVLEKLQNAAATTSPKHSAKSRDMEI